jgi:hypothetical protein
VAVAAKRKASEDIGLQPKRIIHSVLKENESDQLTIDDVKSVKRCIYSACNFLRNSDLSPK